jgi:hypothetical protein
MRTTEVLGVRQEAVRVQPGAVRVENFLHAYRMGSNAYTKKVCTYGKRLNAFSLDLND